jgi:alanine racemase-like protein
VTSTLGISQPRSVDLLPPTLQTVPEAIGKNIAIARARTRSRIMAVVKADGYGHGAITVAQAAVAAGAQATPSPISAKSSMPSIAIPRKVRYSGSDPGRTASFLDHRRASSIVSVS